MKFVSTLEKKDIPLLKKFVAEKFHNQYVLLNNDFFDWQYKNHTSSNNSYSFKIIKNKGEILGYCGFVPVQLQLFDKQVTGAVLANLLIDDKLRGFGLGSLLVKEIMDEHDACYVSGYSEQLRKLSQKLAGWKEMGNLTRMVGVISDLSLKTASLEKKGSFDIRLDELWQKQHSFQFCGVTRNSHYFNWRYAHHPLFDYQLHELIIDGQLKGCAVSRLEEFEYQGNHHVMCRIVDWVCGEANATQLFSSLFSEAAEQGADLCDVFFSGTRWAEVFKNIGLHQNSDTPLLLTPVDTTRKHINWMHCISESLSISGGTQSPDAWFVTKGDGDQDRPNIPRSPL